MTNFSGENLNSSAGPQGERRDSASSRYQAYPEYKDSRVDWLGDIPHHWIATRIKHIGMLKGGAGFPHDEQGVIDQELDLHKVNALGKAGSEGFLEKSENTISLETAKKLGAFVFPERSIVFAKVGAALLLGRIRWLKYPSCLDNNMMGLVVRSVYDSRYIKHAMSIVKFAYVVNPGAIPSLNEFQMGSLFLGVPTLVEQTTIANFLDHETAKIDTLIEKQQQLIQLLKEKRQAVISHAVTKGLNPNASMKDSGVEWLGEVPEGWGISRIKNIVSIPVTDGPHETPNFIDDGVPFVSAEAVSSGEVDFNKIRGFISEEANNIYSKKYFPKKYDIYMVKSGATTGVTAIVETDDVFNIWSPLAVIRCGNNFEPYFVLSFMRSEPFQEAIKLNWSFGTQQNIGMGVIENLHVTCPPKSEAETIAKYLQNEDKKFKSVVSSAYDAIQLMQERRTALISAVVTGKIDVRAWQAPAAKTQDVAL